VVLLVPVLAALALAAFAWPAAGLAPRDLPVGVVGPETAVAAIQQRLAGGGEAVELHRYPDQAAARAAIADREVYGAMILAPDGAGVLTASAASPVVAQLLEQAGSGLAAATGGDPAGAAGDAAAAPAVRVVDVVPADADDPRGAALASSLLPLVLAGMAAGLLVWLGDGSGAARAAALVAAAAVAGLAAAGIAQGWLGVLGGDWWSTPACSA
jgi:hypothetical protein